jgi:hypothetical protein
MQTTTQQFSARQALADLRADAPPRGGIFRGDGRPAYLRHAIDEGAFLATSVHLTLGGEIRLGRWRSFRGEEVLHARRGFVWRARVGAVSGFDALVDGEARQRWALLGLVPVLSCSGSDIVRSAIGRWLLESVWLPPMLLPEEGARWNGSSVHLRRLGETGMLKFGLGPDGQVRQVSMPRWGNPNGLPYDYYPFGVVVESERRFGGYTLPSRLRAGWHFGTDRWDEGEFFRVTVESADFKGE